MVKRKWEEDEKNIKKIYAHLKDNNVPLWLVSFLEGSRFTEKQATAARQFAVEKLQREDLKFSHVLLPRTKGFVTTIKHLSAGDKPYVTHVYDVTIGYGKEHKAPSMLTIFTKPSSLKGQKVFVHVKRYAVDSLPKNDEKLLTQWCYDRFKEKEQMLQYLKTTGNGLVPVEQQRSKKQELGVGESYVYFWQTVASSIWIAAAAAAFYKIKSSL